MNKTLCHEVEEEILESTGDFSQTVKEHLKLCEKCTVLAANWHKLCDLKLPTVDPISPTLDFAVLTAARKAAVSNRWMLPKWFYAISSAACAIMFSWLVIHSHQTEVNRQSTNLAPITAEQALFMLDSESEFNQIFINITPPPEVSENNQEINDIVDDISDGSSDSELFGSLLNTANEALFL